MQTQLGKLAISIKTYFEKINFVVKKSKTELPSRFRTTLDFIEFGSHTSDLANAPALSTTIPLLLFWLLKMSTFMSRFPQIHASDIPALSVLKFE